MVRSMYSGVAGLRSHQTRMDTIGNNIANVNTYGFKSGRTTFRDIYYQQLRGSSQPTGAQGGINPSAVGYGSKVGSVDLMMGNSTFSMTEQTMDIAVDGEGFFQVQDVAGNTFYTRAGMLSFDAAGNLVDMQGNYVLGVNGDPTGRAPASERISVVLNAVPPTPASVVKEINGKQFTITAQNPTPDGNMNLSFTTDPTLADNDVVASLSTTGIVIKFNPQNQYGNINDFNDAINEAITAANNGQPHVAGNFTVTYTGDPAEDPFAALGIGDALSAEEICSTNYNITKGSLRLDASFWGGITPTGNVGNTFGKSFGSVDPPPVMTSITGNFTGNPATDGEWTFRMVIDGVTYQGSVTKAQNSSGKLKLTNIDGDANDFIEVSRPSFNNINAAWKLEKGGNGTPAQFQVNMPVGTPLNVGNTISVDGSNPPFVVTDLMAGDLNAQMVAFAQYLNNLSSRAYTGASFDPTTGRLAFTATNPGQLAAGNLPVFAFGDGTPALPTLTEAIEGDAGTEAVYTFPKPTAAMPVGGTMTFDGIDYIVPAGATTVDAQMTGLAAAINADAGAAYTAAYDTATGTMTLTAKAAGVVADPVLAFDGPDLPGAYAGGGAPAAAFQTDNNGDDIAGTAPAPDLANGASFFNIQNGSPEPSVQDLWARMGTRTAAASRPSRNLGLSGAAFALRGGTLGGEQSLADMTDIQIGTNGIIIGKDSIGTEIIIGRIDLATFANPGGLNQAGSSNFTESQNSGDVILSAPGEGGAGQLVGGTLELSNVDLSREFSDMITTQRGYQANSRIITVSDTMLEELINLKR